MARVFLLASIIISCYCCLTIATNRSEIENTSDTNIIVANLGNDDDSTTPSISLIKEVLDFRNTDNQTVESATDRRTDSNLTDNLSRTIESTTTFLPTINTSIIFEESLSQSKNDTVIKPQSLMTTEDDTATTTEGVTALATTTTIEGEVVLATTIPAIITPPIISIVVDDHTAQQQPHDIVNSSTEILLPIITSTPAIIPHETTVATTNKAPDMLEKKNDTLLLSTTTIPVTTAAADITPDIIALVTTLLPLPSVIAENNTIIDDSGFKKIQDLLDVIHQITSVDDYSIEQLERDLSNMASTMTEIYDSTIAAILLDSSFPENSSTITIIPTVTDVTTVHTIVTHMTKYLNTILIFVNAVAMLIMTLYGGYRFMQCRRRQRNPIVVA